MKRWFILVALLTACDKRDQPPIISIENVDPVVARQITNSVAEVKGAPRSASAWGKLGMVLKTAGMPEARDCFICAERLDPKDPRWPYFQGSIESLKRAAPGRPFIHLRLAQTLLEAGRLSEAEEQFRAAGSPLGQAQVACARGDWAGAVPPLEQARRTQFTAKAATTLLAAAKLRVGQTNEAQSLSFEAAALPPDAAIPNPFEAELAYYAIGKRAWIEEVQRLLAQDQLDAADPIIKQLTSIYPESAEGWLYLGRTRLLQKDFPASEQALARHLQLDPASVDGHLQMGLLRHRQNRLPQAAAEFQKALDTKPDSETAHYFLGVIQRARGNSNAAVHSFREALRHQPGFAPARKALDELTPPR